MRRSRGGDSPWPPEAPRPQAHPHAPFVNPPDSRNSSLSRKGNAVSLHCPAAKKNRGKRQVLRTAGGTTSSDLAAARPPSPKGKALVVQFARGGNGRFRTLRGERPHPTSLRPATFPKGEGFGSTVRPGWKRKIPHTERGTTSSDLAVLGHLPQRGRPSACYSARCAQRIPCPEKNAEKAAKPLAIPALV